MAKSIISKVEDEIVAEEARADRKKKTIGKIKYIIVLLVILVEAVVLGVQLYDRYVPNSQYREAIALMEEGKTKDALLIFEKLDDFKNSRYYCDTVYAENPVFRFDHCNLGDEVVFGKNNYEGVEWTVVNKTDSNVTLISKYIIDAGTFPDESWFTTFKKKGFSEKEAALVEKVFLLNVSDARNYVEGKSYAKTKPTDQVLKNTKYVESNDLGYVWWLDETDLSMFGSSYRVAGQSGRVGYDTKDDSEVAGIRPAISIKIK